MFDDLINDCDAKMLVKGSGLTVSRTDDASPEMVRRFSDFLMKICREVLTETDINVLLSPASVFLVLCMAAEITGGNTRSQVLSLIGEENIENLRILAAEVCSHFPDKVGSDGFLFGNSAWLRNDINYDPKTLGMLGKYPHSYIFTGKMGSEIYDRRLQKWTDEMTGGLLSDKTNGMRFSRAEVISLISAVYFSGTWCREFDHHYTKYKDFHSPNGKVQCCYMNKTFHQMNYLKKRSFSCIDLDYMCGSFMRIILPSKLSCIKSLFKSKEFADVFFGEKDYLEKNGDKKTVEVSMPKFDISNSIDLIDDLKKLGVTDIFDYKKSDFSPLTKELNELYVSSVEHAVRVITDESGSRAAAYCNFSAGGLGCAPRKTIHFTLDRPFIFGIMDPSGFPLFTGIVNDPTKK